MRNTIAPVLLNAGFRGNVIPGSAEATINMRVIPGTKADDVIAEIKNVIGDPNVSVAIAPSAARPGAAAVRRTPTDAIRESSTDTALYRSLASTATALWNAPVTPYLFQAGTDAIAWRSRGIPVYGVYPYPITDDDLSRMHGNDERVPVKSLEEGEKWIYTTLVQVARSAK
jgi:acetylornithine deacetylase/succinyl-diaminopimelate desuccinylase-like protein